MTDSARLTRAACTRVPHASHPAPLLLPCAALLQNVDGINYLYIKKGALYFVATTKVRRSAACTHS